MMTVAPLLFCLGLMDAGHKAPVAVDSFFDSNGVKIHYTVQGKGEPVLLIHGFTASIPLQWGLPGITAALAKNYQVIAFDNRGHGRSGKPHDPKQYGKEMVEDAVRLLDHLHIGQGPRDRLLHGGHDRGQVARHASGSPSQRYPGRIGGSAPRPQVLPTTSWPIRWKRTRASGRC